MVKNTISDAMTRIKNGYLAGLKVVLLPKSKKVEALMKVLAKYKYVSKVETKDNTVSVELKYDNKQPAIIDIKNVSVPGRKVYTPYKAMPRVWGGLGINILSTSKGIMADKDAKKVKQGGELLAQVW